MAGVEPAAAAKENTGRRMGKFPLFQQCAPACNEPGRGARRRKMQTSTAEQDKLDPVLGRDGELPRMGRFWCGGASNPCRGRAGRGQTAVVEGLARRIAAGQVPSTPGTNVLSLDITSLVSTKYGRF